MSSQTADWLVGNKGDVFPSDGKDDPVILSSFAHGKAPRLAHGLNFILVQLISSSSLLSSLDMHVAVCSRHMMSSM